MPMALKSKNKLQFIYGGLPKPLPHDALFVIWDRCNTLVLSWINQSLCSSIAQFVIWLETTYEVWNDLKDRFYQRDIFRICELKEELYSMRQGHTIDVCYRKHGFPPRLKTSGNVNNVTMTRDDTDEKTQNSSEKMQDDSGNFNSMPFTLDQQQVILTIVNQIKSQPLYTINQMSTNPLGFGSRRGASLVALHSSHTPITTELPGGWRLPGRSLVQQVVSEPMIPLGHGGLKGEQTGKCVTWCITCGSSLFPYPGNNGTPQWLEAPQSQSGPTSGIRADGSAGTLWT
ncbi:hypothetical protein Lal_00030066 [Lupinus albus]|nr:hypothetical protein Lal_00030066 [Lupinus albus]